jgi:hypothetical protein
MNCPSYISQTMWDQMSDDEQREELRLLAIEDGKPEVVSVDVGHTYIKSKKAKKAELAKAARNFEEFDIPATFVYDSKTGEIFRRGMSINIEALSQANGHRSVQYAGKRIYSSVLAWLLYYGEWPTRNIRHLNGDRGDNRIVNLGTAGSMPPRFRALIRRGEKLHHIGYFATAEERDAAVFAARLGIEPRG